MTTRRRVAVAPPLLLFLALVEALVGQSALGTAAASGTVRDEREGVIVGARVILTEKSKDLVRETFSNVSGVFLFPSLGAGTYKLEVTAEGFSTYEVDGLRIEVGGRAHLDISLRVGELRTTMTVADVPALLETESNAIGTVVDSRRVSDLPLNGRNFLQLALLAGGVTDVAPANDLIATNVGQPYRSVVLSGSMPYGVGYSLNGVPIRGSRDGELAVSPSIAAIDQFKVEEGFLMPDRGPNPSVVNIATKSGSNQFHGEVFEFLRNRRLDARSFFASLPEDLKRNQFGFAFGGPLWKDKLWFHGFYEGLREITAFSSAGYSPTAEMFAGRLAETGRPVYDPASSSGTSGMRAEFPNSIVPESRINPVARNLSRYYLPGTSLASRPSNVFGNPKNLLDDDQGGLRLDAALNEEHLLFAQLFRQTAPADRPGLYPVSGRSYLNSADLGTLQHTWVLSPTAANILRVAYVRSVAVGVNEGRDQGPILKSIGITNTFDDRGVSTINVSGYSSFGRANGDIGNRDNTWSIDEQFSYLRANHSYKFGAGSSYRRGWHANANALAHGILYFEPLYTAQLTRDEQGQLVALPNTGDSWADFLLGIPSYGELGGLPLIQYRGTQVHPFIQDTWKVTNNLTLNYGLSWHLETPPDPQGWARDSVHGFDSGTGLLTYAKLGQIEPVAIETDLNNFAPRFGLAWKPRFLQNTVVRAGAGVYYSEFPWVFAQFSIVRGSPVGPGQSFLNPRSSPVPVYQLGENIFPPLTAATVDENYAASLPPGTFASAIDPALRTAYVSQWNVSIQQGLGQSGLLEFSYLGSSAHRLVNFLDLNQCRASDLSCNPASKPWPRYALLTWVDSGGNASYEALIAKYHYRRDQGLDLRVEYTLGKALTDSWQSSVFPHSQIATCRRCDKGPATFDVRHRAVASVVWEIPLGRGEDNASRFSDWVLGGWSVTGVVTMSTGQPIPLKGPNQTGSLLIDHLPNRICDGRNSQLSGNVRTNGFFWFDTGCFPAPPPGYFGNSGRTVLNGPGLNNWDLGVEKSFRIGREAARLNVRGEFFNAWNHAQFQLPNGDLRAGANFGRVSATRAPRLIQIGVKLLW